MISHLQKEKQYLSGGEGSEQEELSDLAYSALQRRSEARSHNEEFDSEADVKPIRK